MQAIGGGVLDLVVFLLVVAFALALLFFVERRPGHGARELEALAAPLELRLENRMDPLPLILMIAGQTAGWKIRTSGS
jgi:hypothetical protein